MIGVPIQLGPLRLASNLLLAPIAGYCDLAFRTIVREWSTHPAGVGAGVGLACTDLLSPQGLLRGTATSLDLAATNNFDKPVGMQLYGSDPEIMAQGARWAVEHGATLIDINMGCPVDKVTKKDGGSKLLTDLARAVAIAARVVKELEACSLSTDEWLRRLGNSSLQVPNAKCPVPLTCKIRLCWSDADYHAGNACSPHLARMLADVGVVGVTVHGRTTEMKFSGEVQLAGIARVVESVNGRIPIIGNGDVVEPEHATRMIRETGCAGVMIGRGALSTPWLFRDAWALQISGAIPEEPSKEEIIETVRRYLQLMVQTRGEHYAMVQIRRRMTWFAKRLHTIDERGRIVGVRPLKEAVRIAQSPQEVNDRLDEFLAGGLRSRMPASETADA
ncbi:MAG: tRNA-dihydrouridine synthase [Phycisphaeraceae bacterium]|nr:tRNA-dihydrouridine synthase [Phycisphaeraceae bacterium]